MPVSTVKRAAAVVYAALAVTGASHADFRPPSVPLVTSDPFFSIWSNADQLAAKPTTHWTGKSHRLTSLVRIDGETFRLMGDMPADLPAMKQVRVSVLPTQTIYEFEAKGVKLTLRFTSPLLPDDLELLARPTTYLTWTAQSIDGKAHDTSVYFDAAAEIAVNTPDQNVVASRFDAGELTALRVGTEDQMPLISSGDDQRIDWGHLYVAQKNAGASASITSASSARDAFENGAALPADAAATPAPAGSASVLAVAMPMGSVSEQAVSRHLTLAYDDEYSIQYFREKLRPYWRRNGADAAALLKVADSEYATLIERCDKFDAELVADLKKVGGDSYVNIGVLAWRQALAAQKLCADSNGQPLSFSKENFSNGCIATVDVLYPASPQMLIFSPSLLKASLVPLMDYSASPRWKHDSAPHDLGQYPLAMGQVYGGEATSPMPVEESGNMLIMIAALAKVEGNADFAAKYWPTLTLWYNYLKNHGLDPANQLCTDDFAGHIARNSNLSVKAIMGMAGYGKLAQMLGKDAEAKEAFDTARDYARKWTTMGDNGDHHALVFGDAGKDTWSQKYNLVWDKLLDLNVFPKEVAKTEMAFYQTKLNRFGLPLDSRKDYTKLDWQFWTATMAESDAEFKTYVDAMSKWANETSSRIPLTDWYDTKTGKQSGFQARSVVGGVFIGLMRDPAIWDKYASRDKNKLGNWAALPWEMPPVKTIVATAETESVSWRYTLSEPAKNWNTVEFNDKSWKEGRSGFGTQGTPGATVGTAWSSNSIYLRRSFELADTNFNAPKLYVHHDEDVEIYLNGVLAAKKKGFVVRYTEMPILPAALNALKPGKNTLAVHCKQRTGGQYIDVGLIDAMPVAK